MYYSIERLQAEQPPRIIYAENGLKISVSQYLTKPGLSLLQSALYGTHGPRYRQTGQERKALSIKGPLFFNLYDGDRQIGVYCLSRRTVGIANRKMVSFYGRYLAIDPAYARRGLGRLLKGQAIAYVEQIHHPPYLFYSYIEQSNERSMRISTGMGFERVASLEAVLFSRLYPKVCQQVFRLSNAELPAMLARLEEYYASHTLLQLEHIYDQQNYYVLREGGQIVAGVQANPVQWEIVEMPGLSGKVITRLLPHLPIARRLFNPRQHRFLALEGMYAVAGHEHQMLTLLESVLAENDVYSALLVLDQNSPVLQMLKKLGHLGILNALNQPILTDVMVRAVGLKPTEIKTSLHQPVYISAFDCS